jgi:hypothetical protein
MSSQQSQQSQQPQNNSDDESGFNRFIDITGSNGQRLTRADHILIHNSLTNYEIEPTVIPTVAQATEAVEAVSITKITG